MQGLGAVQSVNRMMMLRPVHAGILAIYEDDSAMI